MHSLESVNEVLYTIARAAVHLFLCVLCSNLIPVLDIQLSGGVCNPSLIPSTLPSQDISFKTNGFYPKILSSL